MAQFKTKKVSEVKKGDNLEFLEGEVVEVEPEREFGEGQRLQQTRIADETGASVKHTLFDEKVGSFEVGDKVKFYNTWVGEFKSDLTLNLSKKPDSKFEIVSKGDGSTKIKTKPRAGTGTFDPTLGARQTAIQAAARIHQGTSASEDTVIAIAEKFEAWLNRP